ncbi:hypothetical protein KCU89_g72, partial [Aureobasidium melanogenum]
MAQGLAGSVGLFDYGRPWSERARFWGGISDLATVLMTRHWFHHSSQRPTRRILLVYRTLRTKFGTPQRFALRLMTLMTGCKNRLRPSTRAFRTSHALSPETITTSAHRYMLLVLMRDDASECAGNTTLDELLPYLAFELEQRCTAEEKCNFHVILLR